MSSNFRIMSTGVLAASRRDLAGWAIVVVGAFAVMIDLLAR